MPFNDPSRTSPRRMRVPLLAAVVIAVGGAVIGLGGILADPPSTASADSTAPDSPATQVPAVAGHEGEPLSPPTSAGATGDSGVALEDGGVVAGTTVFDDELPAVAKLEPELLDAVRRAAADAAADGIAFTLNSGWRSPEYQDRLLREAVVEYGSAEEAARWVATPATSPHVRGEAVDMSLDAAAWLSSHGDEYGLCQIYANESWHYELRRGAADHGCPAMYEDPTHDPRMK